MRTFVQIVNQVLRRLREDTVSNYDDTDYSTLIGDFVNEAISAVQAAPGVQWSALYDDFTLTTDGSSRNYSLTSTESANTRNSSEQTVILGVYNDTDDYDLQRRAYQSVTRAKLYTDDTDNLFWYRENGVDTSGYRRIELYPDVTGKSVVVATYNPHDLIETGSVLVRLPAQVIAAGAYARAVDERGEDAGTAASTAWGLYNDQLGKALVIELGRAHWSERDWRVEGISR